MTSRSRRSSRPPTECDTLDFISSTLDLLRRQEQTALDDLKRLEDMKADALLDPLLFLQCLQLKAIIPPQRQKVITLASSYLPGSLDYLATNSLAYQPTVLTTNLSATQDNPLSLSLMNEMIQNTHSGRSTVTSTPVSSTPSSPMPNTLAMDPEKTKARKTPIRTPTMSERKYSDQKFLEKVDEKKAQMRTTIIDVGKYAGLTKAEKNAIRAAKERERRRRKKEQLGISEALGTTLGSGVTRVSGGHYLRAPTLLMTTDSTQIRSITNPLVAILTNTETEATNDNN